MNSIESNFVPYQIALDVKSIGFNEPCLDYFANGIQQNSWSISYNSDDKNRDFESISRPTFSQAFRFFREKYNIDVKVEKDMADNYYGEKRDNEYPFEYEVITKGFKTFEKAELELLNKLIEIVKNK